MTTTFIPFSARKASMKYATGVTITTSAVLTSFFSSGTEFSGVIKDFTVTPPEGDVDVESFSGEDSNGFQNQKYNESAFSDAQIEGTMVVDSGEILESIAYGSGETVDSTHTRYQVGDGNRVADGALLLALDNGTDQYSVALNNIVITKLGDISLTGTDGHWEVSFTAKCLACDFHVELKD